MAAMKFLALRNPNERWLMDLILLFIPSTARKRLVNRDALIAEPRAFCVKSGLGGGEGFPVVWEQLLDPADRMRGHSREHIAEPGKRLDRIPLAHRDEA